jgi:hypothetical protein
VNSKKIPKNIELKVHGATIQDPTAVANVFNEYYTNITQHILSGNLSFKTNEDNANTIKGNSSNKFLTLWLLVCKRTIPTE